MRTGQADQQRMQEKRARGRANTVFRCSPTESRHSEGNGPSPTLKKAQKVKYCDKYSRSSHTARGHTLWCKLWQLQEPATREQRHARASSRHTAHGTHVGEKAGGDAEASGRAAHTAAGRRDVRVRAEVNVEHEGVGAFHHDFLAGRQGWERGGERGVSGRWREGGSSPHPGAGLEWHRRQMAAALRRAPCTSPVHPRCRTCARVTAGGCAKAAGKRTGNRQSACAC